MLHVVRDFRPPAAASGMFRRRCYKVPLLLVSPKNLSAVLNYNSSSNLLSYATSSTTFVPTRVVVCEQQQSLLPVDTQTTRRHLTKVVELERDLELVEDAGRDALHLSPIPQRRVIHLDRS